jgi:hypothetical protein
MGFRTKELCTEKGEEGYKDPVKKLTGIFSTSKLRLIFIFKHTLQKKHVPKTSQSAY